MFPRIEVSNQKKVTICGRSDDWSYVKVGSNYGWVKSSLLGVNLTKVSKYDTEQIKKTINDLGFIVFYGIAFYGAIVFKQEAMGGGDIKFAISIGLFLGIEKSIYAFVLSFFIGVICLIPFMIINKKSGKEPIPFGTFMAIASMLSFLFSGFIRKFIFVFY